MLMLGWIICGIAAAVVASSKGRGFWSWFFLGVLLGPIALLMVGFMPKAEAETLASEVRPCPFCAETIKAEAIVCKHCGRDVPVAQELERKFVLDPEKGEKRCPVCRKYSPADAKECKHCCFKEAAA